MGNVYAKLLPMKRNFRIKYRKCSHFSWEHLYAAVSDKQTYYFIGIFWYLYVLYQIINEFLSQNIKNWTLLLCKGLFFRRILM